MKILQGGCPKCGNFWLYKILQQILKKSGTGQESFISKHPIFPLAKQWDLNYPEQAEIDVIDISDLQTSYRISSIFRMPIADLQEYFSKTNHVWTHSPICKKSAEIFKFFDKKVYIMRDPRDRAISAAKYYCSDYMFKYYPQEIKDPEEFLRKNFRKLMEEWVWHVYDHLKFSEQYNIHLVSYEGFLLNFSEELSKLLEYLGIELSEEEKMFIEKEVHFSSLKKHNPKHLKKGGSGYWKEILSKEQKEMALDIAGPLINFLNYPVSDEQKMTPERNFTGNFDQLKNGIIESQKILFE